MAIRSLTTLEIFLWIAIGRDYAAKTTTRQREINRFSPRQPALPAWGNMSKNIAILDGCMPPQPRYSTLRYADLRSPYSENLRQNLSPMTSTSYPSALKVGGMA